jgi:hypothetical protein
LGLQVIDPTSGQRLASLETDASRVALSADGAWILLQTWIGPDVRTDVVSAATLGAAEPVDQWNIIAGRSLGGTSLLLATSVSAGPMRVAPVDRPTLDLGKPWKVPDQATLLFP